MHPDHDAVGQVVVGFLAQLVQVAHDITRQPFAAQGVINVGGDGDGVGSFGDDGVAGRVQRFHGGFIGCDFERLPFDRDGGGLPRQQRPRNGGVVFGVQVFAQGFEEFAILGTQFGGVGTHFVGRQLIAGCKAQFLHVQLVQQNGLHFGMFERRAFFCGQADHHRAQRLAHFELGFVAGGQAEAGNRLHKRHLLVQRFVNKRVVRHGEVGQVDALGGVGTHTAHQVLPEVVRQEGREGREQLAEQHQRFVERGKGGGVAVPEAAAVAAHVPVGELVNEDINRARRAGSVERIQFGVHRLDELVQFAEQPLVHDGALRHGRRFPRCGVPVGDVGVGDEEGVGVPERQQEAAHHLFHHVDAKAAFRPGGRGDEEVPAHGVRPMDVEHVPRVHHIALALGHFLPFFVQNQPEHHAVFVGGLVEEQGANGVQGVEPTARLVNGFTNEVGGVLLFEDLFVLERVVPLRVGHGAAVKPDVNHFGHAAHGAATGFTGKGDFVHVGAVQVEVAQILPGAFFQFLHRANADHFAALVARPDGQRRCPIAFTPQRPVNVVFEPVAKAPIADMFGHPVDFAVVFKQLLFVARGLDVPGRAGVVEQRRFAPPAEGVVVDVGFGFVEQAAPPQIFDDERVGFLDKHARPGFDFGNEAPFIVDCEQDGQSVLASHVHVVRTKGGRDVHNPRPVLDAHEVSRHDVGVLLFDGQEAVEWAIVNPGEVFALHLGEDFVVPVEHAQAFLRQNEHVVAVAHFHIVNVFAHRQRHVARQRPRRRGPGEQVHAFFIDDGEFHIDRGVFGFGVAQRYFVAGERRTTPRAIGHHFVVAVEQVAFPEVFENPPDGFDVRVLHRHVGVVEVDPEADAVGQFAPLFDVAEDRFAAEFVEFSHPVLFNLLFARQPQLLFHFQFHREPVRVPPRFAEHVAPLHGAVAWEDVLVDTCEHVPDVRQTVRCGRSFVEDPGLRPFALFDAFFKNAVLFPEVENAFFFFDKLRFIGNRLENSH